MSSVKIGLTINFATPPSIGGGGASGTVADKVVTRNARGEFIIPASQIKGKLRHACEQLLRAQGATLCHAPQPDRMCPHAPEIRNPPCLLCEVFGSPGYPSRLRFHDLVAQDSHLLPDETLRWMVSLNRRRRTAQAKRLFLVETAAHFKGLRFKNDEAITGHLSGKPHLLVLLAGLKLLYSWGGSTTRGLGWSDDRNGLDYLASIEGVPVTKIDVEEVRALCRSST
jgi:CRISPR/Cas system CSM-associated protein Csm3 (group 7 of RAMP superfamily)